MKTITFITLLLFVSSYTFSQSIENVYSEQDGEKINIFYDIVGTKAGQTFSITVSCSSEGKRFALKTVSGDVGEGVSPGKNKKIVWEALKDVDQLSSAEFFVKIDKTNNAGEQGKKEAKLKSDYQLTEIEEIPSGIQEEKRRDVIHLKDGKKVTGLIERRFAIDKIKITDETGTVFTYKPDEIEKITYRFGYTSEYEAVITRKNGDVLKGVISIVIPNNSLTIKASTGNSFDLHPADVKSVGFEKQGNFIAYRSENWISFSPYYSYTGLFADFNACFNKGNNVGGGNSLKEISSFEPSLVVGYQFNPSLSLGIGIGYVKYTYSDGFGSNYSEISSSKKPIWIEFKYVMTHSKLAPYLLVDLGSIYGAAVGLKYFISNSTSLHLDAGFNVLPLDARTSEKVNLTTLKLGITFNGLFKGNNSIQEFKKMTNK